MAVLKIIYKPIGLLLSVLGGVLASTIFSRVWKLVAGEDEKPKATQEHRSWSSALTAAVLQGALYGLVKAAVDRGGAAGFRKATGAWPADA